MKRKIYNELLKWKEKESHRTALLIDGARRVGKSYIAEKFGANEYKSYILIDFFQAGNEVKALTKEAMELLETLPGDKTFIKELFELLVYRKK